VDPGEWDRLVSNLCLSWQGALGYEYARAAPFAELLGLADDLRRYTDKLKK
jgi:hypothetical protein